MKSKPCFPKVATAYVLVLVAISISTTAVRAQDKPLDEARPLTTETLQAIAIDSNAIESATEIIPRPGSETVTANVEKTTPDSNTVSSVSFPDTFRTPRVFGDSSFVVDRKETGVNVSKQASSSSDWEFAFAPYLYASGISGTIGARGRSIEVDASFGNVWENLDIGIMGTFHAKKGKLIFLSDLMWIKMSAERDTPGGLFSTAKIGVNLFIFDPEVGYRLFESKAGALDVLGGVRIWSVENNLNVTTGLLPGFDVSARKTWAAPVVGVHGIVNLSEKFYLTSKFDIGGAGIGADFTTQFFGGVGYRVKPKIALVGGYRFLKVDYDDSSGFIFDTSMSGLMFGAKFSF